MVAARERNFLRKLCAASSAIGAMLSAKGNCLPTKRWKLIGEQNTTNQRESEPRPSSNNGKRADLFKKTASTLT
jgi:hypothetical protein